LLTAEDFYQDVFSDIYVYGTFKDWADNEQELKDFKP
jgi:hypothetical protein